MQTAETIANGRTMQHIDARSDAEDHAETDQAMLAIDEDLASADYSLAHKPCDLIMKGGVTSGIVYPKAICKLARRFFFRNIGGTSAGAIAAGLAAAAELSRRNGRGGLRLLADLPSWLGTGTNLLDLFQPSPKTKPLFRILLGAIGKKSLFTRTCHIVGNLIAAYPFTAAGSALTVVVLAWPIVSAPASAFQAIYAGAATFAIAFITMLVALAVRFFFALRADIPDNGYGLCTGGVRTKASAPLTVWLNERLTEFAGITGVLTFGDLWNAPWPPGQQAQPFTPSGIPLLDEDIERANRSINLEMVTTNLTVGRPQSLPFSSLETDIYYYDPIEFAQLFPPVVLDALKTGSQARMEREPILAQVYRQPDGMQRDVFPLPAAADLPVVVAARMSLSFPILFSAVPLYALPAEDAIKPNQEPQKEWFSDGGLSSNLPLHFFDRPLTRWPTFALNLRTLVPQPTTAPPIRVAMATRFDPDTNTLPATGGTRIMQFLLTIFDTLQNWTDNTQLMMPGYRERVAEVQLSPEQGGLNLDMSSGTREALTTRGAEAGIVLLQHYGGPPATVARAWTTQREVRFFSTMSIGEMWLRHFALGYANPVTPDLSYDDLTRQPAGRSAYWFKTSEQTRWIEKLAKALATLGAEAAAVPPTSSAANGSPEPGPELRTRPRT